MKFLHSRRQIGYHGTKWKGQFQEKAQFKHCENNISYFYRSQGWHGIRSNNSWESEGHTISVSGPLSCNLK